ncbi:MAG: HAMP domain-containing histidine kinase [Deltaproteobacteria bacterium]|nr:HAMP domain-containing histidine kinase [Deltaproteobacteria bacterium]
MLAERIQWFVRIRWAIAALCAAAAVGAGIGLLPEIFDYRYFVGTALFLGAANLFFRWVTARFLRKRRLMVGQVLVDYLAIAVLTYATGGTATPLPMLFLIHIILVSLFFRPLTGLLVTGLGFGCAWVALLASSGASFWYGAILGSSFLFCWYLTCTITQSLKLREEQLEESNAMLERLDREKTQATLRATHELKAPFSAIKSYVYLLRDGYCGELPAEALEVVGRIGDRCDRLTDMIAAILQVGNLRTAVVKEDDFEPVNLVEFMVPEVEEAAVLANARKITVKAAPCQEREIMIRAAPRHLHTMISNLLRNAINYSQEGGDIEVALFSAKRNAVLRITDHGIGIAREQIPKIFDDFFRSTSAARVNPNGNGLGLTLVKEVAKIHSATIEVASEEGQGTIFWVWFPRVSAAAQREDEGGEPARNDDKGEDARRTGEVSHEAHH